MKSIFISAGHDDKDSGAVANEHKEADIVRDFRDLVGWYLDKAGASFVTDGQKGVNIPLREAVRIAAQHDICVEFHLNAGPASATGVETLSAEKDYALARKLCSAVSSRLGIRNRGAKPENSGQHKTLAFVQAGGIILELFFITNKDDLARYEAVKWLLAKDIADILIAEAQHE